MTDLQTTYCEYLQAAALSERTISVYASIVKQFIAVHNPKRVTTQEVTTYIASRKVAATMAQTHGAIKYLLKMFKRPRVIEFVPFPKKTDYLPYIPPKEMMLKIIEGIINIKHRCIVGLLYGTGVRVSELTALQWRDLSRVDGGIEIHVRGKGKKDRIVRISKRVYDLLARFCLEYELNCDTVKTDYIFGGVKPYTVRSVALIVEREGDKAGIRLTPHLIRHACFTHMRATGTDLADIQEMAGHKSMETTRQYARLAPEKIKPVY